MRELRIAKEFDDSTYPLVDHSGVTFYDNELFEEDFERRRLSMISCAFKRRICHPLCAACEIDKSSNDATCLRGSFVIGTIVDNDILSE